MQHIIVDIDGTIADCTHRLHHILEKPRRFDRFYADCLHDTPINDVIGMVMMLSEAGYDIVFCTGRSEVCRNDTDMWLKIQLPNLKYKLIMRPENNNNPDWTVKIQLAHDIGLTPSNVFGIFEDRQQVVEAWRDHGYRCYQVVKGDY